MAFVSATLLICERALREADGVISAIRIVDYLLAPPPELVANIPLEHQAVMVTLVGNIRISRDDNENHEIVMKMVRPDGEESPTVLSTGQPVPIGQIPETPRQIWIIAQVGVIPKQFGTHYFAVSFDGVEVARTQFILAKFSPDNPILKLQARPTLTAS
jgi:hypothetical protein